MPLRLRQRGSSISTACNWIFNFLIVYITPPAINNIGYKTYIIFAALNASFVPVIYFFCTLDCRVGVDALLTCYQILKPKDWLLKMWTGCLPRTRRLAGG